MISFIRRRRLQSNFEKCPERAEQMIRAAEWQFGIEWKAGVSPNVFSINGTIHQQWAMNALEDSGRWLFWLPPTVQGLTRLEAKAKNGTVIACSFQIDSQYQLPEQYIREFIEWMQFYRTLLDLFREDGNLSILDMVDQEWLTRQSENGDILQSNSLPAPIRERLTELFEQVVREPVRRLNDEYTLVTPGEAQRIDRNTVEYFLHHPETWHLRPYGRPQPTQVLDLQVAEDFDLYENQFVLHFLSMLEVRLSHLIQTASVTLEEAERRLPETEVRANFGLIYGAEEEIQKLRRQSQNLREDLVGLRSFDYSVRSLQNHRLFRQVSSLHGSPRANTVLRMHPVYGPLYRLYEDIKLETFAHQRLQWLQEAEHAELGTLYSTYCFLLILRAAHSLHFHAKNVENPTIPILRTSLSASTNPQASNRLLFELVEDPRAKLEVIFPERHPLFPHDELLHVVIRFASDRVSESKRHLWLVPETTWWGEITEQDPLIGGVLDFYERAKLIRQRLQQSFEGDHSVIMIHPTPFSAFKPGADYSSLRMLLNQGDNFTEDKHYDQFGNYQVGVLSIYPAQGDSEERGLTRLKRLLRIHLFQAGLTDLCWNCFGRGQLTLKNDSLRRYECQNSTCRLLWGEVHCSSCGNVYFKMKKPRGSTNSVSFQDEMTAAKSIAAAEAVEGKLAISSACESLDHIDDFWAICPHCGHCEKETKSNRCIRCQAKQNREKSS